MTNKTVDTNQTPRKRAPGGGRKKGDVPAMKAHTIRLPDDLWQHCKAHGGGDAGKYLRQLAQVDKNATPAESQPPAPLDDPA